MSFLLNLPHNLFYLAVFLVVLLVLVGAHEYGHYLFARLFGMGAEEFAIGMGGKPWIVGRRRYLVPIGPYEDPHHRGETNALEGGASTEPAEIVETPDGLALRETTLFTLRPYPLGGFVRIKGMMPEDDGSETRIPGGFFSKAPWKRWIVLAAGPAFSVIAGILLMVPGFMFYGIETPTTDKPVFGALMRDAPAHRAGIQQGDRVLEIDGFKPKDWFDVVANLRDKGTKPIHFVLQRGDRRFERDVVGKLEDKPSAVLDREGKDTGERRRQTKLGSYPPTELERQSFGEAVKLGVLMPVGTVWGLATRIAHPSELKDSVGGPGTMVNATAAAVDEGIWAIFRLAGILSVSVGIFNLLPFPPLDGGQMWIAFIEMLRGGRRLSMKTQIQAIKFGFTMVLLMVGAVLVIDFRRLTGIEKPPIVEKGK